jgi:hypothetical protein
VTLVSACGGGGGGAVTTPSTTVGKSNVLRVVVDSGPTGDNVNRLYTDVTICSPGSTSQCQTIANVLVDTGSTGLRLLASVVDPRLNLGRLTGASGLPVLNCAQFVDNTFAWGPLVMADIALAGKVASKVPVQIIADPAFSAMAGVCSSGTPMNSLRTLGATGIIGLGLFKEDCGAMCETVSNNGFYFTCTTVACTSSTPTKLPISKQLKNPVALFESDNNGIVIDLPAVSPDGATSVAGSLIFGVGTDINNQPPTGSILTTSALGYIATQFEGNTMGTSFIDTGSNGLYFSSRTIPNCLASGSTGFYCPTSTIGLSATLVGSNAKSVAIPFSIGNASALFAGAPKAALPTLGGTFADASSFDWGLPFFYGRRVFMGIEGASLGLEKGPFYAF